MINRIFLSIKCGLFVSVAAVLISLLLGKIIAPYVEMRFGFVPSMLSNVEFLLHMAKAFIWLFICSFFSCLLGVSLMSRPHN